MKASICLSTYNKARYLERVLASIFSQKPPFKFEVIVVDDGSIGDTREVCEDYPVCYHYLERPGYGNPAIPRNTAYRRARGEVVICQSDDVVHGREDTIERLVTDLERGRFLIATVVNTDWQGRVYCDPNGKGWGDGLQVYTNPRARRPLFFLGSLWRDDLYAVGGNDEDFTGPGREDCWFADCLIKGRGLKPEYSSSIIGHHLHHAHTQDWKGVEDSKRVYRRKLADAQRTGVWCSSGGPWEVTWND